MVVHDGPYTIKSSERTRRIFIRTDTTWHTEMDLPLSETAWELRNRLYSLIGLQPNKQSLINCGASIGYKYALAHYRVQNESTIYLLPKMVGGGGGYVGPSVSSEMKGKIRVRKYSTGLPPWRKVKDGLFIDGICRNKLCVAHDRYVICNMGINRKFKFHERLKIACPMCHQRIIDKYKIGFADCQFRLRTQVRGQSIIEKSDWLEVSNGYHLVDNEDKIDYDIFEVNVREIPGVARDG